MKAVPRSNRRSDDFLDQTADRLKAMQAEISKLDTKLVENDIAARRIEADVGWEFAQKVDEIEAALKVSGQKLNVEQWCKKTLGVDIATMRRRKRLYRHWQEYEAARRKAGQCGQSGLVFALALIKDAMPEPQRTGTVLPVRSPTGTKPSAIVLRESGTKSSAIVLPEPCVPGCQLITGDALAELLKLAASSIHTVVTSPPYWPAKRSYAGTGIGFEDTVDVYIAKLVTIFREVRRVLRDDGTLWVNIDDAYDQSDLLFIPARLAMAMQADGWVCRAEIIWQKKGGGRPESATNRPGRDFETVLMFSKTRNGYHYDPDPHRIPLVNPFSRLNRQKTGLNRRDGNRTQTVFGNPLGRLGGSVWEISPAAHYRGSHGATMPEELVRRCLAASCPEGGTVLDPFGGAGTTALVAAQMGFQTIGIEISEAYVQEARERLKAALGDNPVKMAAD
jgi:DNA modification methylase